MNSKIEVIEVIDRKDLKSFIKFPFYLYKNDANWVPPIITDELKTISRHKNYAYDFSEANFFLFKKQGEIVGRVGCILTLNSEKEKDFAKFSRFECINDYEVSSFIFDFISDWAKQKGKKYIHGPLGFTNYDNQGLMVEGFDTIPPITSVYHKPYYKDLFEGYGFEKEQDWIESVIKVPEKVPEKIQSIAQMVRNRYHFKVLDLKSKKELLSYAYKIFECINKAYSRLYYSVLLTDQMIQQFINSYIDILDPELVKIVVKDNEELVGFLISMPSLSRAMQISKGRLFPLGYINILRALRSYDRIDFLLGAVDPDYQGKGIPSIMMVDMIRTINKKKIRFVETNSNLETNNRVLSNWDYFDTNVVRRKRTYRKKIG